MIKVLIVDDQQTVKEIIREYIETDPSLKLVGCASNGQEALDMVETLRPDIVLMDIEMPVLDGLTATKIISERFINTKTLIISVHNEDSYVNTALQVGAKGYLLKNTPEKELIHAIFSAHKGYFQLSPGLLDKYLYKVGKLEGHNQEIQDLKSVILEQSQYLKNISISNGNNKQTSNGNGNGRKYSHSYHEQHSFKVQCAALENQLYVLSNRIDKQNRKIASLQQFGSVILLSCAILGLTFVLQ